MTTVVAGRQFSDSFTTKELAESHRAKLRAAARRGEGFDTETGLPESMVRTLRDVSFYEHCAEFAAATWPVSSAKQRLPRALPTRRCCARHCAKR